MDKIKSAIIHLFRNHTRPESMSNARLVRMLYLADINVRKKYGSPIADVNWEKVPFSQVENQFVNLVKEDDDFVLIPIKNSFGVDKQLIRINQSPQIKINLEPKEIQALDEVLEKTSDLSFDELLVLSECSSAAAPQNRHSRKVYRRNAMAV
jgi:Protein of unknown function (DUF4065)